MYKNRYEIQNNLDNDTIFFNSSSYSYQFLHDYACSLFKISHNILKFQTHTELIKLIKMEDKYGMSLPKLLNRR